MNKNILVCYKSVTGFTKRYAEMIADEMDCGLIDVKNVTSETISQYNTVVFGGRFYAGTIDGLQKVKKLISKNNEKGAGKTFIVFATGAMPGTSEKTLQEAWEKNLSPDELRSIPHFYMPGGLCYEKMPLSEKLMMKTFAAVMKRKLKNKKDKTEEDLQFERMISTSYDLSSKEYIRPLTELLKTSAAT